MDRATEKQISRDRDARDIREGRITPVELRARNHILAGVDLSSFRMVSIGKRPLLRHVIGVPR